MARAGIRTGEQGGKEGSAIKQKRHRRTSR